MSSSDINTEASSSSSDMKDNNDVVLGSWEEIVIKVPDVLVHLIEPNNSVQLANGELSIVALYQNGTAVAVLARVDDEIQWPLAKDEPVVKLDNTHYFFTLRAPVVKEEDQTDRENSSGPKFEILNYGLTVENKEQEELLKELDSVLEKYSCFSVQSVSFEVESGDERREFVEENSGAYWATLAPNVEEYGGSVAKMIAAGSGQLAKGILWCGDVTVDRLNWGHEFVKKRMTARSESDVRPETIAKIKRVKMVTKMTEEVATGILSGVVKLSGFFTSAIVNSKVGKKFFSLLPGEIVLASLDGFNKVFDAIEHAGRNVMSTSSVVTTGLVTQRYGEQAAKVTSVGLGAAGHVIGTAWAVLKIRKALNPKSVIKPKTLAKAAATAHASDLRAKSMEN